MTNFIREKVSRNKKRFTEDGYNLDLSYITDQLIAMGFPSEKVEGLYRNPMKMVQKFFEQRHKDHYKIYNLCAERDYDHSKFHNRVAHYPFEDHNAPPLELIVRCCNDIDEWLKAHPQNVAGIHCKAGKGRTGLIICCYLLHSKQYKTTDEVLEFYGRQRTKDGKGVTIASQQRYIRYYEQVLKMGRLPEMRALYLTRLHIHSLPNFPADPSVIIEMNNYVICKTAPTPRPKENSKSAVEGYDIDCMRTPIYGDIRVQLICQTAARKLKKLCHFWFNTGFIDKSNVLVLKKSEIDVANKDTKCVRFKENFGLTVYFEDMEEKHRGKIPTVLITEDPKGRGSQKKVVSIVMRDPNDDKKDKQIKPSKKQTETSKRISHVSSTPPSKPKKTSDSKSKSKSKSKLIKSANEVNDLSKKDDNKANISDSTLVSSQGEIKSVSDNTESRDKDKDNGNAETRAETKKEADTEKINDDGNIDGDNTKAKHEAAPETKIPPIPVFPDVVSKRKERAKSFYQYKDYSEDEDDAIDNENDNKAEIESNSEAELEEYFESFSSSEDAESVIAPQLIATMAPSSVNSNNTTANAANKINGATQKNELLMETTSSSIPKPIQTELMNDSGSHKIRDEREVADPLQENRNIKEEIKSPKETNEINIQNKEKASKKSPASKMEASADKEDEDKHSKKPFIENNEPSTKETVVTKETITQETDTRVEDRSQYKEASIENDKTSKDGVTKKEKTSKKANANKENVIKKETSTDQKIEEKYRKEASSKEDEKIPKETRGRNDEKRAKKENKASKETSPELESKKSPKDRVVENEILKESHSMNEDEMQPKESATKKDKKDKKMSKEHSKEKKEKKSSQLIHNQKDDSPVKKSSTAEDDKFSKETSVKKGDEKTPKEKRARKDEKQPKKENKPSKETSPEPKSEKSPEVADKKDMKSPKATRVATKAKNLLDEEKETKSNGPQAKEESATEDTSTRSKEETTLKDAFVEKNSFSDVQMGNIIPTPPKQTHDEKKPTFSLGKSPQELSNLVNITQVTSSSSMRTIERTNSSPLIQTGIDSPKNETSSSGGDNTEAKGTKINEAISSTTIESKEVAVHKNDSKSRIEKQDQKMTRQIKTSDKKSSKEREKSKSEVEIVVSSLQSSQSPSLGHDTSLEGTSSTKESKQSSSKKGKESKSSPESRTSKKKLKLGEGDDDKGEKSQKTRTKDKSEKRNEGSEATPQAEKKSVK